MSNMPDTLPLKGMYKTNRFCDYAARSAYARQAYVVKMDLLKDRRVVEWWRHEMLAFTVVHGDEVHLLFFERSREESESGWLKDSFMFAWRGFKGNMDDLMEFCHPDSEWAKEKVEHCVSVLQVDVKPNKLTLHSLARVIKRGPYYGQFSQYHLFSANCWSWARGLLLDVTLQHSLFVDHAYLLVGGSPGAPMTVEELQVCMLTQYGAWGGLLLQITSSELEATSEPTSDPRRIYWVKRLRHLLVRMVLATVSSIHVYVSTAFSCETPPPEGTTEPTTHPFVRRDDAVKCSIMRMLADGTFLEVGRPRQIELRKTSAHIAGSSRRPQRYAGVIRIDGDDDFARQVQSGDTIVLWAQGRPDQVQHPSYASLKVVSHSPSLGLIGLGYIAGLLFKGSALYQYLHIHPAIAVFMVILFYIIDTYIKDWVWSALTNVMKIVFISSIPLPLPSDAEATINFDLPDFIEHCTKADRSILKSPLKSVTLVQEKDRGATLIVDFEHSGVRYLAEVFTPLPKYDLWHYLSFMTTRHRLDRETMKLSRWEGEEGAAHTRDQEGLAAHISFSFEGKSTFSEVVDLLHTAKRRYWFHFWCNDKDWSWPWWLLRCLLYPADHGIDFVRMNAGSEAYSPEDASEILFRARDEYKAARVYDYGKDMVKDAIFVISRTRAVCLIALFAVSQQALSPLVGDAWNMIGRLVTRIYVKLAK